MLHVDTITLSLYSSFIETAAGGSLALLLKILRLRSVQHLQELGHTVSHTRMHVGLGALDMIVEVISKDLDVAYASLSSLRRKVAGKEYKSNIANVIRDLEVGYVANLQRRFLLRIEHLRRVLNSTSSSVNKLLQKDLTKDSVGLILENS